jgi:hypothetical protein
MTIHVSSYLRNLICLWAGSKFHLVLSKGYHSCQLSKRKEL